MSLAQDTTQFHYTGETGSRHHHGGQGPASSMLAATTYGIPYNPLATPSNVSAYGSISWPASNSVGASIWSQNHQGSAHWPSSASHMRAGCTGYYDQTGGYAYAPRFYGSVPYAQHPSNHQAAQTAMRQNVHQPHQQILMIPQVPAVQHIQPHMQAPLMAPYVASAVNNHPSFAVRAPLQPYQNIAPHDPAPIEAEYDIAMFSQFYTSAATGILPDSSRHLDINSIEQFVSTLLCATRLPKSTLFVSLVLLNKWDKVNLKDPHSIPLKCHIISSLVLANKMNDDNTFTNSSWGIVSGMPAKQITKFEVAWLHGLEWRLVLDENGTAEWNYWQKCWNHYEQSLLARGPRSPLSPQNGWNRDGLMFEQPFSVAAC